MPFKSEPHRVVWSHMQARPVDLVENVLLCRALINQSGFHSHIMKV